MLSPFNTWLPFGDVSFHSQLVGSYTAHAVSCECSDNEVARKKRILTTISNCKTHKHRSHKGIMYSPTVPSCIAKQNTIRPPKPPYKTIIFTLRNAHSNHTRKAHMTTKLEKSVNKDISFIAQLQRDKIRLCFNTAHKRQVKIKMLY